MSGSMDARWNVELESHDECVGDQNEQREPAIPRDLGAPCELLGGATIFGYADGRQTAKIVENQWTQLGDSPK